MEGAGQGVGDRIELLITKGTKVHEGTGAETKSLREIRALGGSGFCVLYRETAHCLVVVVLVPIAFLVPAVLVFIPPLMPFAPATLPCRVQFTTLVICLSAVAPVFFDCFVEFMLRVDDSALASFDIFRLKARQCGAKQDSGEKDY
jgi:hypothetical protein